MGEYVGVTSLLKLWAVANLTAILWGIAHNANLGQNCSSRCLVGARYLNRESIMCAEMGMGRAYAGIWGLLI